MQYNILYQIKLIIRYTQALVDMDIIALKCVKLY